VDEDDDEDDDEDEEEEEEEEEDPLSFAPFDLERVFLDLVFGFVFGSSSETTGITVSILIVISDATSL